MGSLSLIAYNAYLKMIDMGSGQIVKKALPYEKTGCT